MKGFWTEPEKFFSKAGLGSPYWSFWRTTFVVFIELKKFNKLSSAINEKSLYFFLGIIAALCGFLFLLMSYFKDLSPVNE